MTNPVHAIKILSTLNSLGIQLSIDDFGTVFSSLSYLKKLPVHEIKIDKSFVMHMMQDKNDEMIVHSTINLSHNMNLHVVAEGVEDEATLQHLKTLGCDTVQGYYISHPLPESELKNGWNSITSLISVYPFIHFVTSPLLRLTYFW